MMLIRDIRKAVKDFDFSDFFVDRDGKPAWEKWEKVLTEAGVKGVTRILQERVLSKRWGLRRECDTDDEFDWVMPAIVDLNWTRIPNVFGHWTESHDYMDDPNTRLHTWMDYKGWIKDEFSREPSTLEDKELMHDLGLVKESWSRLTNHGIVTKSWEDDNWYE